MTTYLAKAIFRLSRMKNPDGIKLCDQVCIKLSGMTSAQLKTTTDSLNFYFVGKRMSWNNASIADENTRADVVDLRRPRRCPPRRGPRSGMRRAGTATSS
jgi:hypothetical protein